MILASSIAPAVSNSANETKVPLQQIPKIEVVELGFEIIDSKRNISAQDYVANYFSDIPVMIEVAKCESRFRQHDKDGSVLRGIVNSSDVGVMQINEYYHLKDAKALGYDLHSIEGNTAYARYLFEKKGLSPWVHSSPCWKKTTAYSNYQELALK